MEALEAPIGDFETVNVDTPNKQTHKEKLEVGAVLSLLLDAADNIISHHYYGCLSYLYRNNGWLLISSSFSSMLRLVRNTHINLNRIVSITISLLALFLLRCIQLIRYIFAQSVFSKSIKHGSCNVSRVRSHSSDVQMMTTKLFVISYQFSN